MIADLRHRQGEWIQDRYEILGELGSGAFGTVYRCRDSELDTLVAIKELHVLNNPNTPSDERGAALAQFRREAINLSNLRHPHIVSGHYQPHAGTWLICPVCGHAFRGSPHCPEHGAKPVVVRQRHYLVMEYLEGHNLEEAALATGGALPIEAALRYIRHTAEALQLIHGRGWVHRDVKPDNIRLRRSTGAALANDAVLLDFGIATESGAAGDFGTRQQRHTTGGGTMGYAPDSSEERRYPDARSDIHALGMTLYRLLTGLDPQEPGDLVKIRRFRPCDFNTNIPPRLEDLIMRSVQSDPSHRPQTVEEFLREIRMLVEPHAHVHGHTPPQSTLQPAQNLPPGRPFSFDSGEVATNVTQLAKLCDKYPAEAQEYLFNDDFATWMRSIGREDVAVRAGQIRVEYARKRAQGLEAFIQFTGCLPPPSLSVHPKALDFGIVYIGQSRTVDVHLENSGRGHLFGLVNTKYSNLHFPGEFEGNRTTVPVTLDTKGLDRGTYQGDVVVDSSGGEMHIPFHFTVHRKRSWAPALSVILWSLAGMLSGQLLRTLPFLDSNGRGFGWLTPTFDFGEQRMAVSVMFGVAMWGVLMMLTVAEATRRKSCGTLMSGALAAATIAFFAAAAGPQLLVAGDQALRPHMWDLVRNWATGGWMFVGGLLGASYGTLRRWRDVFTTRVSQILVGWLLAIILLYLLLAAAVLPQQSGVVRLLFPT
jgi:serine/threonine protein kinase